jgi:hypothetical protein
MEYVIITQLKNEDWRIYGWLSYHYNQGFDTFIIFDDFSTDNTLNEIERFKTNFGGVNIITQKTDGVGGSYGKNTNPFHYGHDKSLNERIMRSYTNGNNIVKAQNPGAICVFIDVDEFLVTDEKTKVTKIIDSLFNEGIDQILVFNFDVKDEYESNSNYLTQSNNYYRWDFDSMNSHNVWSTRCKSIIKSDKLELVTFVHFILNPWETKTNWVRNYTKLRMHHYRKPNLDSLSWVEDNTIKNILINT